MQGPNHYEQPFHQGATRGAVWTLRGQRQPGGEDRSGIEARGPFQHPLQAEPEHAGRGQQHEGERHLRHDETVPQAMRGRTGGAVLVGGFTGLFHRVGLVFGLVGHGVGLLVGDLTGVGGSFGRGVGGFGSLLTGVFGGIFLRAVASGDGQAEGERRRQSNEFLHFSLPLFGWEACITKRRRPR